MWLFWGGDFGCSKKGAQRVVSASCELPRRGWGGLEVSPLGASPWGTPRLHWCEDHVNQARGTEAEEHYLGHSCGRGSFSALPHHLEQ